MQRKRPQTTRTMGIYHAQALYNVHISSHLILMTILQGTYYRYFTDEESVAQSNLLKVTQLL